MEQWIHVYSHIFIDIFICKHIFIYQENVSSFEGSVVYSAEDKIAALISMNEDTIRDERRNNKKNYEVENFNDSSQETLGGSSSNQKSSSRKKSSQSSHSTLSQATNSGRKEEKRRIAQTKLNSAMIQLPPVLSQIQKKLSTER
jgi:hypothetical protein